LAAVAILAVLLTALHGRRRGGWSAGWQWWWRESEVPWRAFFFTCAALFVLVSAVLSLAADYHVLGTDRTGNDVLWLSLKSVRTARAWCALLAAAVCALPRAACPPLAVPSRLSRGPPLTPPPPWLPGREGSVPGPPRRAPYQGRRRLTASGRPPCCRKSEPDW